MAGPGVPFQVLRWFPASLPGAPCPPERLEARARAREDAVARAVRDRVSRVPLPQDPPVGRPSRVSLPQDPPVGGPGQALAEALGSGGDLASLLRRLTDAQYDAAIISNLSAFALGTPSRPLIITPGTALLAADNQMADRPLFVRVKAATDGNGVATNLYVAGNRSDAASGSATAPIALYAVAPTVELVLNGFGQVWVDGTAPGGAATFTVLVTTFQINGRNTVYPR